MPRNRQHIHLWAVLLGLIGGCVTPDAGHRKVEFKPLKYVWPPPPDPPRLVYEHSLSAPEDFGFRTSWLDRLGAFLAGSNRNSEALVKPCGVAVDEAGNLCLTDTGANVVLFFDLARKRCRRWSQVGGFRFLSPVAVAKHKGVIYVADSDLHRVLGFTEEGKLLVQIGDPLERPTGLAVSGGRLYVTDARAHMVRVFDLNGRLQSTFGGHGEAPGQFNFPTHVAADAAGRIYVTDSMNSRVQVFDPAGKYINEIGSRGDSSGHFSRPKGVAVDRLGHVYISDALFDNIQIFDPDGRFLLNVGSAGGAPGEFWLPAGIAVGPDDRIYIADSFNRRIQVLVYVGQP